MAHDVPTAATTLLQRLGAGDSSAGDALLGLVYDELHRLAQAALRAERKDHTLQATALVHEAWLRLVGTQAFDARGRAHFFGAAARSMRQILVDHARSRGAVKRGGAATRLPLDEALLLWEERALDLLGLDEALGRLAAHDERLARIVELRFFAGCEMAEVAAQLGVSVPTVERSWRLARAWLRAELDPQA